MVQLLEAADLLIGEVDSKGRNGIGKMMWLGRPDGGSSNDGILQHPGQCDLRHRDATFLFFSGVRMGSGAASVGSMIMRPERSSPRTSPEP
jgi:hypothetical protein